MLLDEVREKFPEYGAWSDDKLASALYKKHYAQDMTRDEFDRMAGIEKSNLSIGGVNIKNTSAGKTVVDKAMQGLTFGYADEISDVLGAAGASLLTDGDASKFGEYYKEARRLSERDLAAQQEEHPWLSLAAEVGGGMLTGAAGASSGIGKAYMGRLANQPSTFKKAVQMGKTGGNLGALYGFGSGFGAEDRLVGTGGGYVGGAAFGGATPYVAKAGKSALSKLGGITGSDDPVKALAKGGSHAERELIKRYKDRPDLDEVVTQAKAAMKSADDAGIPINAAEALNDESLMREIGSLREEPAVLGKVQKFFEDRQERLIPNALDELQGGISPVNVDQANEALIQSANDVRKSMVDALQAKAAPYYDKAFELTDVMTPELNKILNRPSVRKAMRNAASMMREQSKNIGKTDPELTRLVKELDGLGKMKDPLSGGITKGFRMETLHYIKKGLDDVIDSPKYKNPVTGRLTQEGKIINETKNQLVKEMGKISPDYDMGRSLYSENISEMEDILKGRFARLMNATDLQKETATKQLFAGTAKGTKDTARLLPPETVKKGASGELRRVIETNKQSSFTIPDKVMGSARQKQQWKTLLGDDYEKFEATMETIKRAAKGTKSSLGSPTEMKERASDRLKQGAQEMGGDLLLGNKFGVFSKLKDLMVELSNPKAKPQFVKEKAELLLSDRGVELLDRLNEAVKLGGKNSTKVITTLDDIDDLLGGAAGGAITNQ